MATDRRGRRRAGGSQVTGPNWWDDGPVPPAPGGSDPIVVVIFIFIGLAAIVGVSCALLGWWRS